MAGPQDDAEAYVGASFGRLLQAAYLLTGSQPAAEDLAQETVVRVLVAWSKVARADDRDASVVRIMLHQFLRGRRRRWTGEVPTERLPERSGTSAYDAVEDRDVVLRALRTLPPRQRAAVVLRHYEHLSEAETAHVLRCSVGTVKSQTSRGLATLRVLLTEESLHD